MCQHVIHVASGTQTRVVKCSNCREATVGGGEKGGRGIVPRLFPACRRGNDPGNEAGGGEGVKKCQL